MQQLVMVMLLPHITLSSSVLSLVEFRQSLAACWTWNFSSLRRSVPENFRHVHISFKFFLSLMMRLTIEAQLYD